MRMDPGGDVTLTARATPVSGLTPARRISRLPCKAHSLQELLKTRVVQQDVSKHAREAQHLECALLVSFLEQRQRLRPFPESKMNDRQMLGRYISGVRAALQFRQDLASLLSAALNAINVTEPGSPAWQ